MGSRERKATMTELERQIRVVVKKKGSENRRGTIEFPDGGYRSVNRLRGQEDVRSQGKPSRSPVMSNGGRVMEEQSEI